MVQQEQVELIIMVEQEYQVKEIQVAVQTEALLEETLTLAVAAVEKEAQVKVDHLLLLEELV